MASVAVMANTDVVAGVPAQPPHDVTKRTRARKPLRPNYNHIHRNLLPVETYPLPTLIPHNPLSLIAIALSYLTRIIAPPERKLFKGYFSSTTSSVHCTDHDTIRSLWEMGFFGRGNLSRSEPTWQESQKRKGATAEENTGQRRMERKQQKLERARKEQEEIAQQLSIEQQVGEDIDVLPSIEESSEVATGSLDTNVIRTNRTNMSGITDVLDTASNDKPNETELGEEWKKTISANGIPTPPPSIVSEGDLDRPVKRLQRSKTVRFSPTIEAREFDLSSPVISPIKSPGTTGNIDVAEAKALPPTSVPESTPNTITISASSAVSATAAPHIPIQEPEHKEHLNLSLEEAFFLSYGLGVLNVYCEDSDTILSPSSLLSLFRRHSYHPVRCLSMAQQPDDPFMVSYAVYHHYRSLGWVIRSGVKFSVDYLLYNRGPAFNHADFAIVVLPSYSHPYWAETIERRKYVISKTKKSWDWLHGVNRVQAQVHKSLVLCYVEIPPPLTKAERGQDTDIGKELSRYTVRDVSVKRWTPNRTRD